MSNQHLNRPIPDSNGHTRAAGQSGPRVLMVLKRPGGKGGMQQQARRVALGMIELGVPVMVLSHRRKPPRKKPRWEQELPITYLKARNQWGFAYQLYRYFVSRREEYDLIHIHGFGLETVAAIAARRVTHKPVIVKPSTAGAGTKLGVYAALAKWIPVFWRRLWSGIDCWVSISSQIRADLVSMGIRENRIRDIPNGVDLDRYHPAELDARKALRSEAGLSDVDVVVCSVSRLSPHKRVDVLVRVFLEIAEGHPEYRLWVFGKGELLSELQAMIAAHPAGQQVRLMGFVGSRKAARFLQAADVFALISRWEGLSNALLEAMACGLAPLVTDVSGMVDVVLPDERGIVVPLDDDAALKAALIRLCEDAALRKRFGLAASQAVKAQYSLDGTVERLLELYGSCQNAGGNAVGLTSGQVGRSVEPLVSGARTEPDGR